MKFAKLNILVLCVFLLGVLALTGCESGLTSEEIQAKLIEANSNLNTYSFDMIMNMDLTTEVNGEEMNVVTTMDLKGKFDRLNKKMSMIGIMKMSIAGQEIDVDTQTYMIDNMIYTKGMNLWIKMEFNADLWDQQDQIGQLTELIKSGGIEILEDDSFDGKSFYLVKINPDMAKLVEGVLQQQEQADLFNFDMDFSDMIRSYTSTVWVNKDTFVIEKSVADIDMVMTPENMGIETDEFGEMKIASHTEVLMYGVDQPVDITLPEEALSAVDLADLQAQLSEQQ